MESKNNCSRIEHFHPYIDSLKSATATDLSTFHAGEGYETFDTYISGKEAESDAKTGAGVTHLIWDELTKTTKELVAYFTITATVIPYDDGIDKNPRICDLPSIPSLEIKMFAVSEKYQDVLFKANDLDMPVSAWCMQAIIQYADNFSNNIAGIQALFCTPFLQRNNFT